MRMNSPHEKYGGATAQDLTSRKALSTFTVFRGNFGEYPVFPETFFVVWTENLVFIRVFG